MSLTVLGGVLVFVLGQIVLKLMIEPAQNLKRTIADISYSILLHQAEITNAHADREIAQTIKTESAKLIADASVIVCYPLSQVLFGLPSRKNATRASRKLNFVYYGMLPETKAAESAPNWLAEKTDFASENYTAIEEVGRLLKIKTTYLD